MKARGGAMNNVSLKDIAEMTVPLPPLAEQHRIVDKVEQLMVLCDRLHGALAAGNDRRRRLLDALIAEALNPAGLTAAGEMTPLGAGHPIAKRFAGRVTDAKSQAAAGGRTEDRTMDGAA